MTKGWILLAAFLLPLGLVAEGWQIEGRVGYFVPSSTIVKKMFRNGWVDCAVEGVYHIEGRWDAWGNVGYGLKRGHSVPQQNGTELWIVPASLGIAGAFGFPISFPLSCRLGAGASYTYVNTKNHSHFVERHLSKSAFGFVFKTNFHYPFWVKFYANLFADYAYTIIKARGVDCVKRYDLNLSGLRTGLGLGIKF